MRYIKLFEEWNYKSNEKIDRLKDQARKMELEDFLEEYVDLYDIIIKNNNIKKGDTVEMKLRKKDDDGKTVYKNGISEFTHYKTVVADKDYRSKHWKFILDNTKELQEEAKKIYYKYKNKKKPEFKKDAKTVEAYHASPRKFNQFKYGQEKSGTNITSDVGFFFFLDIKNAKYFANVLKENRGKSYLYIVDVQIGEQVVYKGEEIGTGWGRFGDLEQAEIEGYDTVLIEDADTGYGITDELVVFDDDNIRIKKIIEY